MADFSQDKIKRDHLHLYEHYVVAFYKRISGRPATTIFDIHEEAYKMISQMEWKTIIRPFVIDDLESKHDNGRMALAQKYQVTPHCILTIGQEIGYWK